MAKSKKKEEAGESTKVSRRAQYGQMWQAFNVLRKQDKMLVPYMLLTWVLVAVAFFLLGLWVGGKWFMLVVGFLFGFVAALFVFTRRMENSVYAQADGQPGAAGWALDNMRNGVGMVWKTKQAVAATTQMDAVHRVVGLCGIVLVGEGEHRRLKPLMAQEKKRLARVAGPVPIYEIYAGNGEDEVPIKKLQRELVKLPRNISKDEVYSLSARLDSIGGHAGSNPGLPKGPIPKGAKIAGTGRRARRAAERQQRGK